MKTFYALLALLLLAAWTHGSGQPPSNASIPVTSLSTGNFSANNWTGITSPASNIATTSGLKYITPQSYPSATVMATGTGIWRDQEITSYFTKGELEVRMLGGNGIFFSVGVAQPGGLRMGIVTGFSAASPESGTRYDTYVQDSPATCITGWNTDGTHTFTLGARGFNVYLLIDGVQAIDTCQTTPINPSGAINYYEYRPEALNAGQAQIWIGAGGARDISINYYPRTTLYSAYANNTFDPRDFGWRDIAAVTGSMSASGTTLTLSGARDIRVGDQVIVEIGGEAGAGARNTIGVGGVSPSLHYATTTAMNAVTNKADSTLAYLDTTGVVYQSTSGVWTAYNFIPYYTSLKNPLSLVARVTAVNASPATTLTLNTAATVDTTNANVYIDVSAAMYPLTKLPAEYFQTGRSDSYDNYAGMIISLPAATMYAGVKNDVLGTAKRDSFTVQGASRTTTLIKTAKGTPNSFIESTFNDNATVKNFTHTGNLGANGFGYSISANGQFSGVSGQAIKLQGTNAVALNMGTNDEFGQGITLAGTNPTIDGHVISFTQVQEEYLGWQSQLSNCTGGIIKNSSSTSVKLLKTFEMFACNGAEIRDITATNGLTSTNSSTSVTFTRPNLTIQANAFYVIGSGWLDEPIMSINDSAFGSGNTVTIVDPRIIQSGYVDNVNTSLVAISVLHTAITDVTITGSYPGGGGCSTALGGLFQAPDYNASTNEYGSMAVYSSSARTVVSGIRVKGTAIGSPGHSSHFGNISLTGASSSVTNSIADAIQTGPTLSGNQTNSAYGGC